MSGLWMFLLVMPVMVPFFQAHGLNMIEVFELQTIYALAMVTFEVPSGYVADLVGRKRCLMLASVLYGISFTWLAAADGFGELVAFECLVALAASLRSGTDVALLYDSLEALGEEADGTRVLGRRLFWSQTGETLAALVTTALVAAAGIMAPALANAVTAWLPLLVIVTLVEPPRRKLAGSHKDNVRKIARALLVESPLLRLVLFTLIAYGLATLLVVWAVQDYWRVLGVPLELFGLLWAAYNLVVALVGGAGHRVRAALGVRSVVLLVGALPLAGYLGLALFAPSDAAPSPLPMIVGGVLCGFLFQVGRGLTQVVVRDELNQRVSTSMRATANSISSLGVRLAFAGLGPLLGWLIDTKGYDSAFFAFAGLYLGLGLLLAVPLSFRLAKESDGDQPPPASGV